MIDCVEVAECFVCDAQAGKKVSGAVSGVKGKVSSKK